MMQSRGEGMKEEVVVVVVIVENTHQRTEQ
jgi:hypothetical protein